LIDSGAHSYLKARLSVSSLNYLLDNYSGIKNVLQRYMVIQILVNMVRDGKYSALSFMKFFAT